MAELWDELRELGGVMMKTQYYAASSLDGYLATEDHSLEWLLQFGSVEATSYPEFIRDVGALAMGSNTYEWLLENLIDLDAPEREKWPYTQPAWVFTSRSLPKVGDADIRFVQGDVVPVYKEMIGEAGGKNLWIVGGGELAGQFYDAGLLDELIVQVMPVTLGKGRPLFPRRLSQPPLKLLSAATYGEVFVEIRYEIPKPE